MAGPDGTFGNRFDDPEGTYRVLYGSSQRLGCYLETLARFRVDLTLFAELAEIDGEDDFFPAGQVPQQWAQTRVIGSATHYGTYADMYGSDWIGILRRELAAECIQFRIEDLDASVLQHAAPRSLTQRASRVAFNRGFDGIHYRSRYGHDVRNWALFEPFKIEPKEVAAVDLTDPDLQCALTIHGLKLGVP